MNWNLNKLKNKIASLKYWILAIIVIFILLAIITYQQIPRNTVQQPNIPPPISQQPLINGRFDITAETSKTSRKTIDNLIPKLPFKRTIVTSSGQEVSYVIFVNPKDDYTLHIEIININFRDIHGSPTLPKNVLDFRDTAGDIFAWMEQNNVKPRDVFISWGDLEFVQISAEAWLLESPKYPKVIKEGENFVFEVPPQINQP